MYSQFEAETAQRDIVEVRSLIGRQQDLIAGLTARGLNAADIEATLKALTAQLELLEQQLAEHSDGAPVTAERRHR